MYSAQVATLGLELYEMPVKLWVLGLHHRPSLRRVFFPAVDWGITSEKHLYHVVEYAVFTLNIPLDSLSVLLGHQATW
jgi:hypothetical protein